jgi:mannose-6-phosphate isomerase-like protein (cupin superfamily)
MYKDNIEKQTEDNVNFRHVLATGPHLQLVVMALKPGEEIGLETHEDTDQFFRIEVGEATFIINGEEHTAGDGDAVIVPAGKEHNVINKGDVPLKLYTIYAPPHHPEGTVHKTKEEADAAE